MDTATVSSLMRPPITIQHTATLEEVVRKMVSEKRNSLVVINDDGAFAGAVNAIDVIKAVLPDYLEDDAIAARFADETLMKQDAHKVRGMVISEFMSKDLPTITEKTHIVEAAVQASKLGRGRIVVVDENKKPVGVLTRTEIKQVIASYFD